MDEIDELEQQKALERLLEEDPRFSLETYLFVNDALDRAYELGLAEMKQTEGKDGELTDDVDPHVTGADLCRVVVACAVAQFGMLAKTVLDSFGLHTTGDIGDVVYNMIRVGLMEKTQDDSRDDFDDVFDLPAELDGAFKFHYEKRRR